MKRIEVNILGKRYPLRVDESEVETTHDIARYVNERMKKYRKELPQQSITTVMVMAAMSLAEEAMENESPAEPPASSDRISQINNQLEDILDEVRESTTTGKNDSESQEENDS